MIIKDYELKGNVVRVSTDKGAFAYPDDKFSSVEALNAEIARKIAWREKRGDEPKKKDLLIASFKKNGVKEKVKDESVVPVVPEVLH